MEQAAILKSGTCVRLIGLTSPAYTIGGFLNLFYKDGKKYRETLKSDFREEDQWHIEAIGGFYQEEAFLKYLNKDEEMPLYKLKEYYFKFDLAENGDQINVRKLKLVPPFSEFCVIETYKWTYQKNVILVNLSTGILIIPPGVSPDPPNGETITLFSNTPNLFYTSKINLFVTPLTDPDEKAAKAYLFAKIALRIHQIKKEIFQLFNTTINTDFATFMNNQDNQWVSEPIFINPTYSILEEYYTGLTNFYKNAYANQLLIEQAPKEEKFYWLARCLSPEALSIVPTVDKIKLLKSISEMKIMTEGNGSELLAINITESFTFTSVLASDRNDFLDALMENQVYSVTNVYNQTSNYNTNKTLFEILYSKIDDNRSARYTFGLLDTLDNRKAFILMLYKVWKSSKYNPKYADPSYTLPANAFGVYPQSYYMELVVDTGNPIFKTKYYDPVSAPAFLYYKSTSNDNINVNSVDVDYIIDSISGKKIAINISTTTKKFLGYGIGQAPRYDIDTDEVLYGTYDLYQPIALIGFKPDLSFLETFKDPETGVNLNNPTPSIPVFLLYYMEDYSNIKKLDFGIMLAAEIALNLTGVGALSNLRYLGYLSKARAVWTGTATASETLLLWEAVAGVNAAVQFTAGSLLAISNYVGNTSTDSDIVDFTRKVNVLLGFLTLGSLLSNPAMKRKLFDAAADVLAQEQKLIGLGKVHGLDIDTMNAIRGLYDVDALIDLMHLKLTNLPSYAGDTILLRFNNFTQTEKYDFFVYFYNIQEESKWIKMNFQHTRVVGGTTQTYTWVDVWKNEVQTLKNYRNYEFLDSFDKFRYVKPNEYKHIRFLQAGDKGGHWFVYVTDDISATSSVKYKIVNTGVSNTSIPVNLRTTVENVNGHLLYKNLWKFNSNTTNHLLSGVNVSKKADHYIINPLWNEERVLEEMSFAWSNKYEFDQIIDIPRFGRTENNITTRYRSVFSDGTKVEFRYRNYDKDPVSGNIVDQHLSLMTIVKSYKP